MKTPHDWIINIACYLFRIAKKVYQLIDYFNNNPII